MDLSITKTKKLGYSAKELMEMDFNFPRHEIIIHGKSFDCEVDDQSRNLYSLYLYETGENREIASIYMVLYDNNCVKLKELRVEKSFQRKGLGSYLMEQIINKFDDKEIQLAIDFWSGTPSSVIKSFYEKYGFVMMDKNDDQLMYRKPTEGN